jgi:pSer/pThr/pTyr-binding forkhead associated (FHA) protein
MVAPPPPIGAVAPPPVVAPPPMMAGAAAPPMMRPPGPVGGGAVAPPPIVAAPPLVSPGVLSGPSGAPVSSQRVLVGFLVTFQNDPSGSFWPIHSGRTQLGRAGGDPTVEVSLADASASSRHATIHADPATGQAFIEDDSSRNGTYLNEQRLPPNERRQLRDNDRVRVGSMTLVIKLLVS